MRNASGHQCKVKMSGSEKKVNENAYDISSIKRVTKGAFQKSELAGRTMAGPDILAVKYTFSKKFCWKTISFVHNI